MTFNAPKASTLLDAFRRGKFMFARQDDVVPEEVISPPQDEAVLRLHAQIIAAVPDKEKLQNSIFTSCLSGVSDVEKLALIFDLTRHAFRSQYSHRANTTSFDLRRLTSCTIENIRDYHASGAHIAQGEYTLRDVFYARDELIRVGVYTEGNGVIRSLGAHARINHIFENGSRMWHRTTPLNYYDELDIVNSVEKNYEQVDRVVDYFRADDSLVVRQILKMNKEAKLRQAVRKHSETMTGQGNQVHAAGFDPKHLEDYLGTPSALSDGLL